jgi:hypothetical protein
VKALIQTCSHDIQLVAVQVLRILSMAVRCGADAVLEAAATALDDFCLHARTIWPSGEREVHEEFAHLVRFFVDLAAKSSAEKPGMATRKVIGLRAIHSITLHESLSITDPCYLDVVMPTVLDSIWPHTDCKAEYEGEQEQHGGEPDCPACLSMRCVLHLMVNSDEMETQFFAEQAVGHISRRLQNANANQEIAEAESKRATRVLGILCRPKSCRHRAVVLGVISEEMERRHDTVKDDGDDAMMMSALVRALQQLQESSDNDSSPDTLLLHQHMAQVIPPGKESISPDKLDDTAILRPSATSLVHHPRLRSQKASLSWNTSKLASINSKANLVEPESKGGREEGGSIGVLSVGELKRALSRDIHSPEMLPRDTLPLRWSKDGI